MAFNLPACVNIYPGDVNKTAKMPGDQGPMLKQCCCGCSLKAGTIIIGVLYLVGSLVVMGNAWYRATNPDGRVHNDPQFQNNLNLLLDDKQEQILVQDDDQFGSYFTTQAVFAGIQALAAVLLLVGAGQERNGLILPWLFVEAIVMIVHGIVFIALAVISFSADNAVAGAIFFGSLLIYAALSIYFYLVIYSFYQTLKVRNDARMV